MPRIFAITLAESVAALRPGQVARIPFTVTNTSGRDVNARAELRSGEGGAAPDWCRISGESARSFQEAETHQYTVEVSFPENAQPAVHNFRLDMIDVEEPDENYSEGPATSVELKAPEPEAKKPFPWWVVAAVLAAALVGAGLFWILSGSPELLPDLREMSREQAVAYLTGKGLEYTIEESPTADMAPGRILAQKPPPQTDISTIEDPVSFVAAVEGKVVPNVVGRPMGSALLAIQDAGLRFEFKYEFNRNAARNNRVKSQTPLANRVVAAGSIMQLTIYSNRIQVFQPLELLQGADIQRLDPDTIRRLRQPIQIPQRPPN